MPQQLALGEFVFGLATGFPYDRLARKTTGGWVDLDIISSKPLSHNTGQGLETLRLSGKAQWGAGMAKVDELRAMANSRAPFTLVDGLGRNWGRWRIDGVGEDQERVIDDGTASLLNWTLELSEFVNA
ncbi:phage tail protein [Pseudomonas aeruginosa]|uniref:phage tail protein n=1 Tax=Pseudomonas aeruginosa TaxID=287 RepID=UPI001BCA3AF4|nr:phage tail protein [Pseudomonas aeruginosa]